MLVNRNCGHCPDFKKKCAGGDSSCMCLGCPRDLATCIVTKYCRETESVLILDDYGEGNDEGLRKDF